MQPPSNPNLIEKMRIPPHLLKPYESRENVTDSCRRFAQTKNIPSPNQEQEMETNISLLFPPHNSSSLILAPPRNRPSRIIDLEKEIEYELKHGYLDPKMDRKQLRRVVSNRLSAQRARLRKAEYVIDLERRVANLAEMVSVLTSQIECYKEKWKLLLLENNALQRLLRTRLNESKLSEIELEKKQIEVARLKELEKTLSKNIHDPNAGGQQTQDFTSEQLIIPQYASLGLYEDGLKKMRSEQFREEEVISTSALLVQSGPIRAPDSGSEQPGNDQQPGSAKKLPIPFLTAKEDQGESEIDQYLNFDN